VKKLVLVLPGDSSTHPVICGASPLKRGTIPWEGKPFPYCLGLLARGLLVFVGSQKTLQLTTTKILPTLYYK